jgi:hypothetical protein
MIFSSILCYFYPEIIKRLRTNTDTAVYQYVDTYRRLPIVNLFSYVQIGRFAKAKQELSLVVNAAFACFKSSLHAISHHSMSHSENIHHQECSHSLALLPPSGSGGPFRRISTLTLLTDASIKIAVSEWLFFWIISCHNYQMGCHRILGASHRSLTYVNLVRP